MPLGGGPRLIPEPREDPVPSGFCCVPLALPVPGTTLLSNRAFDSATSRLTYRYAGRDLRLTDVHGHVFDALIA